MYISEESYIIITERETGVGLFLLTSYLNYSLQILYVQDIIIPRNDEDISWAWSELPRASRPTSALQSSGVKSPGRCDVGRHHRLCRRVQQTDSVTDMEVAITGLRQFNL